MSQMSKEDTQQPSSENDASVSEGQTVQMNPAILGQAANMNPASEMFKQLDAASQMLEHAAQESEASPGGSPGNDPTIEEYMAALIARSRQPGQEVDEQQAAVVPPAEPFSAATEPASKATASASIVAEPVEQGAWKQVSAPECRDTISELRELANMNARSSFNVYRGQQLVFEMNNKLSVTLVALVVSFALTSLANDARSPTFFAAIAALIVAICWTVKYFHLGRQLHQLCFASNENEEWQS